jgi:DNA mismatch endonuclease (patch repair protein)
MDIVSSHERSVMMARIGARDTKPEIRVRRFLHSLGFRYRLHERVLPGRPDIVLPRYKTCVLVNGCFWHRCPHCKKGRKMPSTNEAFWSEKIARNVERDSENCEKLTAAGWRLVTVWECQTRTNVALREALSPLLHARECSGSSVTAEN